MSNFLGQLADQITAQFGLGENTNHTLDSIDPLTGNNIKYGSLGDFAGKFDQSAQRNYLEEGYLRRDPHNTNIKQLQILLQEPSATILVKKKMFTSVAENFHTDYMDQDEKMYFKSIRILFQNKCTQIAALEKLYKFQKISKAVGKFDAQMMPIIFSLTDQISQDPNSILGQNTFSNNNSFANSDLGKYIGIMDRIRKIYSFNFSNDYTTWITNVNKLFQSTMGTGTGTIEITNFTSLRTTTGIDGGNFSFEVSDPYQMTLITEWDIEKAISDATNSFYNNKLYQFGQTNIDQIISNKKTQLNQLRVARTASTLSFKISENTLLGRKIVVVVDANGLELSFSYDSSGGTGFPGLGGFSDGSVTVSDDYLKDGEVLGYNGLDSGELSVFKALINAIYSKMQLQANSQNAIITNNKNTNYTRRKMRFNFVGKHIIQPMDVVNIYVNSKSRYDNKVLSGLSNMFTGNGILQNLNKTYSDMTSAINLAFNPSSISVQAEKSIFVGSDFPNYLWSILRNQFVCEQEGTHIFGGVVENVSDSWNSGSFKLNVNGKDNSYYFEQGRINFKPGPENFNGAMWDPLTPFKSNFDSVTDNQSKDVPELLTENKALLSSSSSAKQKIIKYKSGPCVGNPATEYSAHDQMVDPTTGRLTRIFYAPDGLVYKWKEGIGIFTQFGSSLSLNDPNLVGNPNTFVEPFAGQDIMNVLSLLITGQPYNFATYWRAVTTLQGMANDPQSGQNAINSYISSLSQSLNKSNSLWGNFVPFKNLVINEAAYSQALQNANTIRTANEKIDANIKELAVLNIECITNGNKTLENVNEITDNATKASINQRKTELYNSIDSEIAEIKAKSKTMNYDFGVDGDVTFDVDQFMDSASSNQNTRRDLRRKVNYLTRRMSYNVRANEDRNLLIIDDSYDKDYDMLAYNKAIQKGIDLYTNDFTSTKEKIGTVAGLLNLEVFCDSQGHVRIRPPQYNRMPSSVFYRMMYLKQTSGVQVFPEFLANIFNDQITTFKKRIEICEDYIRLYSAALGNNNDNLVTQFITGSDSNKGSPFYFISDEKNGDISDIGKLIKSANPETANSDKDQSFVNLQNQLKITKPIFTNEQRFNVIKSSLQQEAKNQSFNEHPVFIPGLSSTVDQANNSERINTLISRIQTKSAERVPRDFYIQDLSKSGSIIEASDSTRIDYFDVTEKLSVKIRERQQLAKLFYSSLKNANEYQSLDNDKNNKTSNALLAPALFGNKNIPEVFEHMIEDEGYDDYGPGSGSRYIIKDSQIKSLTLSEHRPDYNTVQVKGLLNDFGSIADNQVEGLEVPGMGNGLTSATAIDYDSWRTYGLIQPSVIEVPFLKDPINQCAPFAAMLLSKARKNIFQGTVNVVGNEYLQPGEVYFLESRGMLFYVTQVSHNFSYSDSGGTFSTDLELKYGHTPGEYIPTTLDMIGKLIYNNKDSSNYVIQRQSSSNNDIQIGALLCSEVSSSSSIGGKDDKAPNPVSDFNSKVISNILFTAANVINSNNVANNQVLAKLELRIYHEGTPNSTLLNFANSMAEIFKNGNIGPKTTYTAPALGNNKDKNGNDIVTVQSVDTTIDNKNNPKDIRSPSQKAIDLARQQANATSNSTEGTGILSQNKLKEALFKYVVDCWITFENANTLKIKEEF